MASSIRRLAVLTSGTDGPGMNAAVRAVVRMALGLDWSVYGVRHGFSGLLRGDYTPLVSRSVSHIIDTGGTFLGTSRGEAFDTEWALRDALRNLNEEGIDALVAIGGPTCARAADMMTGAGFPVTLVPASIENDLWGTDDAIGVDTAINTAMDAIDNIKYTASSQQQAFVVELAGSESGYLTLMTGIVSGAEITCIPEVEYTLEQVADEVAATYVRGKQHCIVVVAESAQPNAQAIVQHLAERERETGFEAKLINLGYVQRGGSPMARDRTLGTRMGAAAVQALADGEPGVMVGTVSGRLVRVPIADVLAHRREIDPYHVRLAGMLAR